MTEKPPPPPPKKPVKKPSRVASALRENLQRRKQAAVPAKPAKG